MKKIIAIITILATSAFFQIANAQTLRNSNDVVKNIAGAGGYSASTNENTLLDTVSLIIRILLSLLGVIFLVLIIYGGYLWMVDQGNNDKIKKAQDIIKAAIIGLVIVMMAYAISYFVVYKLSLGSIQEGGSASPTDQNK